MAIATGQSYIQYGWELAASFKTETTSYDKVFGSGQNLNITARNNLVSVRGVGNRNATTTVAGRFEGAATVECIMANPWWIYAVLGTVSSDGGATPYTHTYVEANTLPSFSIEQGNELGTTDSARALLGCVCNSMTLTASIGEPVRLTFDIFYATEEEDTTLDATPATESFDTYFFQQGTLTIGSAVTVMQTVSFTITNNVEMVFGVGSRIATAYVAKAREYALTFTAAFEDDDWLELLYGQAASPKDDVIPVANATATLVFTNGLTLANERTITVTLASMYFNEETLPVRTDELLTEDITGIALSCTNIVAEDATATAL